MSRFLMVDIGAGTMDILFYDDEADLSYKAVVQSPMLSIAEQAARLPGNLLLNGCEMGGGTISSILKKRAQEAEVVMSVSAAATIHHNLERVTALGIKVVEDREVEALSQSGKYSVLTLSDLEPERLRNIVEGFGVPFAFDILGVCAQDHGAAPPGVSHLDYRHHIFRGVLDENPFPEALLYHKNEVPTALNRLRSIAESCNWLPAGDVYVMDSGMAAILGASLDIQAAAKQKILVLDIATSHTVGAALERGELAAFFEYHTRDITLKRLEQLLPELAEGKLEHSQILAEGGHGAYTRKSLGFQACEIIVATGPKRKLLQNSQLPIHFGAPFGDNMMTGTVGLLEAIRRRQGLKPMRYV